MDYCPFLQGNCPSTKETVIRALRTEQVRSRCTSEYSTPDHSYVAAKCGRSIQGQSCADLYTARPSAIKTPRAYPTGPVMHPNSQSHAPVDQEVLQVCHPYGYSTLNPNAVPCASTYRCICGSVLFTRHMKLEIFTNFTYNVPPPVFLISLGFAAIFHTHKNEQKKPPLMPYIAFMVDTSIPFLQN